MGWMTMGLFAGNPCAAQTSLFEVPKGFWLISPSKPGVLYGPTDRDATWSIAAWDIPDELPAFDANRRSANKWAQVSWLSQGRFELAQQTGSLPCVRRFPSGDQLVNELDLFASPNTKVYPSYPQAADHSTVPLELIKTLEIQTTVSIKTLKLIDKSCKVTFAGSIVAVVLSNSADRQTLFYQLRLAEVNSLSSPTKIASMSPGWFWLGKNQQSGGLGQWGFDDNVTSFGRHWAQVGQVIDFQFDIAPRLRSLITEAAASGLSQHLGEWTVTGAYQGQIAMGHVANDVVWTPLSLVAR